MKKTALVIIIVLILNFIVVFSCVKSGLSKGDVILRFGERQTVTILSGVMLALISMISLILYLLKKRLAIFDKGRRFWLFSAIGFFYFCMDEFLWLMKAWMKLLLLCLERISNT